MAIIYSYPLVFPSVSDLILGTNTSKTIDGTIRNTTVNFTVQNLLSLISDTTGAQNFQQVTNLGSTTTNAITINNTLTVGANLSVTGAFLDSTSSPGTLNQVLSSTVTGTRWITDNAGLNYYVTGASYTSGTLTLTRNGGLGSLTATGFLEVGTGATDALAGNTTTITAAQATAITANTAKVGITTAQANEIIANTAKVGDTGVPAILSNGSVPSLNTNITGAEVRTLIGAATANTGINEEVVVNAGVALLAKTVTVPSTATSIAANGFEGEAITSLILNSNLITISAFAFNDNRLPTISLPNTLQTISSNAFNKNLLIGTLVIPASVTSIGERAFFASSDKLLNKITGLTLSSTNLTTIGVEAFRNNPIATNITFPTSVTSIGNNSFNNTLLSGVTIPNNCTVGNSVFSQAGLPSGNGFASSFTLTIGTGVTLGDNCFFNLKHVSSLTLPSDVTLAAGGFQFAADASAGTNTITAITYAGTTYSSGMFSGQSIASLTINNNSVVNSSAFNANPLSSLTIGTGVTLKGFCIANMPAGTSLTVTIPTGTTLDGASTFTSSKNITSVVMGAIAIIPQNMFGGCNNIASLTLNNATTTYGVGCFKDALASNITQITFGGSAKTFGNDAFELNSLTAVTVPIGSTNTSGAFDSGVTITFA